MSSKTIKIEIPESISSRTEYKRKFSLLELYASIVAAPQAISIIGQNKKTNLVDSNFIERLQLAVTEVNGCAACSYQHTKMALKQGMSNEEIKSFLIGSNSFIKPEEAKAILFAQHYADSRAFPKKYAYDALIKEYGENKAKIILSACQIMIAGNIYGIPYSAFQSRLKGRPFKDSSLFYELGMLFAGIVFIPFAIIQSLLKKLIGLPNQKFDKTMDE
ncbi:MAG TPA: carboxymuconolactone decarboxylase family protein [Edaphocola sp.]|nr:carboxymuconolactone decarboxylase family protein [Edaphocola sp.]